MSIVLQSSAGGQITLQEPTTASNFTQTLPAASGEVMVSGNMPAFSATKSSNQTVTSGVFTTITFDVEQFDTNNNFASNTFTPTVAGYYQINGSIYASATSITRLVPQLLKNGGSYRFGTDVPLATGAGEYRGSVSTVVYMNGTTDYLNLAVLLIGTGTINLGNLIDNNAFNGVLVRSA